MKQEDVNTKAGEVSRISLNYHFTHAVFACNKLLEDKFKSSHKKTSKLKEKLEDAYRKKNKGEISKLVKDINTLSIPKYRIFVDYVDLSTPEAARVVKAEDKLIITLPKALSESTRTTSGTYNPTVVYNLRRIMAHELGHIVLHTDTLLSIDDANGSNNITGQLEIEADWFAEELMRLRLERNKILSKVLSP